MNIRTYKTLNQHSKIKIDFLTYNFGFPPQYLPTVSQKLKTVTKNKSLFCFIKYKLP